MKTSDNPTSRGRVLTGLIAFSLAAQGLLVAQTAPSQTAKPAASSAATAADDSTIVELNPFIVDVSKDKGYKATNATSGTRLNTAIKDLPMPISVITEQFLRDTGSTDLRQSLRYTAGILLQSQNDQGTPGGAYQGPGGVNNPEGATANVTQTSYKIRGYVTDAVLRDGFRRQNSTDSVNISRIEVAFGPTALLYGFGEFGGIVNYIPKSPLAKKQTEVTLGLGTEEFKRATIDTTGPLSPTWSFNYRLTAAFEDAGSWTDFNTQRHNFISPAISFKPTPTTLVEADFELGQQWLDGVGFRRVRAMANVGINSDQNEHADFYNVPGTDKRTFRWSGPDTYVNTKANNLHAKISQQLAKDMTLLVGYNHAVADYTSRDVQGNLIQNAGPAALRARVYFTTLDTKNGDSNLNAVNGYVDNTILQYQWFDGKNDTSHDQFRAELNYKFGLLETASKWLKMEHSFLLGHSEENGVSQTESSRTKDGTYNFKSPTDSSYIRFGKQGDGTADAAMLRYSGNFSKGWDQASYLVYQGKFLADRLTVISGVRDDHTDSLSTYTDFIANKSTPSRSAKVMEKTYQNGVSLQITRELSVFGLKAGGLVPNFTGHKDIDGNPMGPTLAKSKEFGAKIDLFDGKLSGSISSYKIKRTGTELFYWWAPTSNYKYFNAAKDIVYNVSNFSPANVAGGSNGGNGAAESAISQWNAGVAAGAIYQKAVGGTTNWYVNASKAQGAAYLDAVFDKTKALGMSWPGWLYNNDAETNNNWDNRASSPAGNEYVVGSDSSSGWSCELMFTPNNNFQVVASYAHTTRVIDDAGKFAKSPYPQDRWSVWYFPNTDWGLTGKPLATVYPNAQDTSTWTGIGYGTGEKQDDTPDHAVNVWANYKFTSGSLKGFAAGVGSLWESPREYQSGITHGGGQRVTDKNGNLVILKTPSRLNVDLMLRYSFKVHEHDAALQLNVNNLLDDQKLYGLIYAAPRSMHLEYSQKF